MTKKVRTRMAPSPTGEFHIGGMRTLLYNFALVKQSGGEFILRIEDTDQNREVPGAKERIKRVIKDYGFSWDEYYEQSERVEIYKKSAFELVDKGFAYFCFCSEERLEKLREEQKKKGLPTTKYDKKCRNIPLGEAKTRVGKGEKFVIRLKVPENEEISFKDAVLGDINFNSKELEDIVLLKSDGFPTYHLAVVIDDHLMGITRILRGNEWVSSTPKHVLLYKSFGWEMPIHGHLPNLKEVGSNKKLSKRFGDVHARAFLEKGYLPEALLNFIMLLGWNPGSDKEFYTLEEFIKEFSIEKIHKTDLVSFDRNKLDWMNSEYIKKLTDTEFAKRVKPFAHPKADDKRLKKLAPLVKDRIKKLSEFRSLTDFIFEEKDPVAITENYTSYISNATQSLLEVKDWNREGINQSLMGTITNNKFKTGDFFMDLRGTLSGSRITPPINESMEIIGREETLQRLKRGLEKFKK